MPIRLFELFTLFLLVAVVVCSAMPFMTSPLEQDDNVPTFPSNFTEANTKLIVSEGVTLDCVAKVEVQVGKSHYNCSTEFGWWSVLKRYDIGKMALLWPQDNTLQCLIFNTGGYVGPLPTPGFAGFEYVTQSKWQGQPAKNYRINNGGYYTGRTLLTVNGRPKVVLDGKWGNVYALYYQNEPSSFDSSVFEIPLACVPSEKEGRILTEEEAMHLPEMMRPEPKVLAAMAKSEKGNKQKKVHDRSSLSTLRRFPPNVPLPKSFDNRRFCTPVRDQGDCGSCWSFASAGLAEIIHYRQQNQSAPGNNSGWFSMQSLIDCVHGTDHGTTSYVTKGCFGGVPHTALQYLAKHGIATEETYRYDAANGNICRRNHASTNGSLTILNPIASAFFIDNTTMYNLEYAVAMHGGFVALMNSNVASWFLWDGQGVYNDPDCTPGTSHAVLVMGYGTMDGVDYWLVKNSFGAQWGDAGYFRIAKGVNRCGIETYIAGAEGPGGLR